MRGIWLRLGVRAEAYRGRQMEERSRSTISSVGRETGASPSHRSFSTHMVISSAQLTTAEPGPATPAAILQPAASYSNFRVVPPAVGARLSSTAFKEEPTRPARPLASSPMQLGTSMGQAKQVAEQRDQTAPRMGAARSMSSRPTRVEAGRKKCCTAFKAVPTGRIPTAVWFRTERETCSELPSTEVLPRATSIWVAGPSSSSSAGLPDGPSQLSINSWAARMAWAQSGASRLIPKEISMDTTEYGGGLVLPFGYGTIFELSPESGGSWSESVLHTFTGETDGGIPAGGVILDSAGNLYGTARAGGSSQAGNGGGAAFKLTPTSGGGWSLTTLHDFLAPTDGQQPGPLVRNPSGGFYGTSSFGGAQQDGTVFELNP